MSRDRKAPERPIMRGPRRHGPGGMTIEKPRDARGTLRRLLGYLGDYKVHLLMVAALTVLNTLLSLAAPYLQGVAIDRFIAGGDRAGLVRITLALLATYVVGAAASMAAGYLMAGVGQRSLWKLRRDLFHHIQGLSLDFFDSRPTGDLMSRLTNDVDAIGQALTANVTQILTSTLTVVGILVAMFSLNTKLALVSLLVFPLMVFFTAVVGSRTRGSFQQLQANLGRLNGFISETLGGQRVVVAYNQQETVKKEFASRNREVKRIGTRALIYAMLVPPLVGILSNANVAIVAGVGGYLVLQGATTVGTIAAFITYSRRFADPLRHFANLYNNLLAALAGAERIFEVLDTEPTVVDDPEAETAPRFQGHVCFEEVDFEYRPGVRVLKKVSLEAKPGEMVALVGPTGAGKTTIVNLLTRFYDPQGGRITIDGKDIRRLRKDSLRRQLGIVLQDVFLFSGSVLDNIRYGNPEATDEDCVAAAKLANAHGFITRLPQGYHTDLRERAVNLSQGQRQLISIARAIVADPSILVLDEATSSVDTRTEAQIQEALHRLMEGRTSFVIAHRLSTIRNADQVLVILGGRVVERGTHGSLMAQRGYYYNLYMSQFKGTRGEGYEYVKLLPGEPTPRPRRLEGEGGEEANT